MTDSANQGELLKKILHERIVVIDGAMGTMIQGFKLGEADYRGQQFANYSCDLKGNNDLLVHYPARNHRTDSPPIS